MRRGLKKSLEDRIAFLEKELASIKAERYDHLTEDLTEDKRAYIRALAREQLRGNNSALREHNRMEKKRLGIAS